MSTLKVDTILKRTGTGTITLGQSGDTISVPTGASLSLQGGSNGQALTTDGSGTLSFATVGGDNKPFFKVALSATQNNVGTGSVKVNFNHRLIDPDSVFDISNYRFLPTTAGKYFFNVNTRLYSSNSDASMSLRLFKNGSEIDRMSEQRHSGQTYSILVGSSIQEANGSSDYFEVYTSISQNTADITADPSNYIFTYFEGFKLIT